jgi:Hydantoinase B/oxoprolinase
VEIDEKDGSAYLDFSGTGCEIRGNLNTPISVVHSAVIYCMRAMLDSDIPLNAGCLVPLKSMVVSDFRCLVTIDLVYSQHSTGITSLAVSGGRNLWRKCSDFSKDCGRSIKGIPCLCGEPRMHQVSIRRYRDKIDVEYMNSLAT